MNLCARVGAQMIGIAIDARSVIGIDLIKRSRGVKRGFGGLNDSLVISDQNDAVVLVKCHRAPYEQPR
jgi:hypothetical protein